MSAQAKSETPPSGRLHVVRTLCSVLSGDNSTSVNWLHHGVCGSSGIAVNTLSICLLNYYIQQFDWFLYVSWYCIEGWDCLGRNKNLPSHSVFVDSKALEFIAGTLPSIPRTMYFPMICGNAEVWVLCLQSFSRCI